MPKPFFAHDSRARMTLRKLAFVLPLALLLGACDEGEISVRLTDAPADDLARFEVGVAGVDIEHSDGSLTNFDFDPTRVIDIVPLRNGDAISLLEGAGVDADDYRAVVLRFAPPSNPGSGAPAARTNGDQLGIIYETDSARAEVDFSIDDFGSESLLVDLDLRSSVRENNEDIGNARLRFRPQTRAVIDGAAGAIAGTIGSSIVNRAQCLPGVYLYKDFDRTPATLDAEQPPLASEVPSTINITGTPYRIGAVASGEYTVAVTCDARFDDPESEESEGTVTFISTANVRVSAGQVVTQDFQ